MIQIAIWKNQSKDGTLYLKGSFFGLDVLIFPLNEKTSPNSPDYVLKVVKKKEKEAGGGVEI